MSLNLVIAFLALTVIMTNVHRIEMLPARSSISKDDYLTRAWGESSVPFTVIYSNYARTRTQHTSNTTTKPPVVAKTTPQNRRQNTTTKKPSQLSNLFVSNGWGPLG